MVKKKTESSRPEITSGGTPKPLLFLRYRLPLARVTRALRPRRLGVESDLPGYKNKTNKKYTSRKRYARRVCRAQIVRVLSRQT